MKCTVVGLLLVLVASVSVVFAREPVPGSAGAYADAAGTVSTLSVVPNVPFNVYAVGFDHPGGLLAYEVGFAGFPADVFMLSATTLGVGLPPTVVGPNSADFIVGTAGCLDQGGPLPLVTLNLLAPSEVPADTIVELRGTDPSSFEGLPGWADCAEEIFSYATPAPGCVTNGEIYPVGALVLNASMDCPVSGATVGFGELKARFD